jgi:(p)ppGpp synthase/HD superfamily hydrolase
MNSFADVNDVIHFRMVVEENNPDMCYTLLGGVNRFLGPYLG